MNIHHEDFDKILDIILDIIRNKLRERIKFEDIKSIESNFDTKGMMFKSKDSSLSSGTIIVGEDNGLIAVDISMDDGEVISFVLRDIEDKAGIDNIINWFRANYE